MPLIYSLEKASGKERKEILSAIKDGNRKDFSRKARRVLDFVSHHGGLEYTERRAREFSLEAMKQIQSFPDSPSKQSLLRFADFVVEREK
jgi:octaprenyl-diphosphate synthase